MGIFIAPGFNPGIMDCRRSRRMALAISIQYPAQKQSKPLKWFLALDAWPISHG
jgi:hypothetical protein